MKVSLDIYRQYTPTHESHMTDRTNMLTDRTKMLTDTYFVFCEKRKLVVTLISALI